MDNRERIAALEAEGILPREELGLLLRTVGGEDEAFLFARARAVCESRYGKAVYIRGLIEFSNHCRNNCYYCGIRRDNLRAERYRLSPEEILACTDRGYELGFRTFVLQSGEDLWWTDERLVSLISRIKDRHGDCAITLSIGEKSRESYERYYDAGAERYLLRQETSDPAHYRQLHPKELSIENRKRCLRDLKEIGYQVGCGIMVGSPGQGMEQVLEDLFFMKEFHPQMIGIGPFIPHRDTPFGDRPQGGLKETLHLLAVLRLMLPDVLLPATTALGTISPTGREQGILAGANVVMPNLTPGAVRGKYLLYDGKLCTGEEAAECRDSLERRIAGIGYQVTVGRGDCVSFVRGEGR